MINVRQQAALQLILLWGERATHTELHAAWDATHLGTTLTSLRKRGLAGFASNGPRPKGFGADHERWWGDLRWFVTDKGRRVLEMQTGCGSIR